MQRYPVQRPLATRGRPLRLRDALDLRRLEPNVEPEDADRGGRELPWARCLGGRGLAPRAAFLWLAFFVSL